MIFEILEQLRENNGGNYKLDVLKEHINNELFKKVLLYTYTPFKQYYIKQLPTPVNSMNESDDFISLEDGLKFLDRLANRELTGNNAREQLAFTVDHMTVGDAQVLLHIVDRNLECGISAKTINKIWKDLIPEIPYMRCEKLNEKTKKNIKYPALVQLKADGTFVNIIKHKKNVSCMTRNGTEFHVNKIQTFFEDFDTWSDDFVITGEVVLYKDGKVLPRKTGNGLINSYVKREQTRESILTKQKNLVNEGKINTKSFDKLKKDLTEKEIEWHGVETMMVIEGWDIIPYNDWVAGKSDTKYIDRFEKFKNMAEKCPFLDIIPTEDVKSFEEAQKYANDRMAEGLEGGVLKNKDGIWENKTSKNQIKLKAELDADLEIIDYIPGEGEFAGGIGSLICRTIDGKLIVSVGTGLSRNQRGLERVDEEDMTKGLRLLSELNSIEEFFESEYKNKIAAIKYNEVIKSESKDTLSLFLPVFVEIRFDKDTADTVERLK